LKIEGKWNKYVRKTEIAIIVLAYPRNRLFSISFDILSLF